MRILIAEDDPGTRLLLKSQLIKWGYEVDAYSDGKEAWKAILNKNSPRLMILDWIMPGMDGIEICSEIRRLDQREYFYIILLSSKSGKENIVRGLEAGADDYVTKPFDPNELKVRLRAGDRILCLQSELVRINERLEYQATHDPLTGLYNRGEILSMLRKEMARTGRENCSFGMIMADIDHFKLINDRHGHLAGDAVLCETAQRLAKAIRPYDHVGRYGGEEFFLVLPGCDLENTRTLAERLRSLFDEKPIICREGVFLITLSFGVSVFMNCSRSSWEELVRIVDSALYRAKENGRNRVEIGVQDFYPEKDNACAC